MGIGVSLFLIAVGLIMALAFGDGETTIGPFELTTAGWILAIIGALGLVLSMFLWSSWADRRRGVVEDRTVVRDREVI